MKQLVKIFVPVAAAAIALFSCAKETKAPVANEGFRISVNTTVADLDVPAVSSKTYMGDNNTILWGTGEQMRLAITTDTTIFVSSASTDAYDGEKKATFEFKLANPPSGSSYTYQGFYPTSAAISSENNRPEAFKVELPAIQVATAASYDPAAYPLVAYPQTFDEVKTEWQAYFRRAAALNKVTLTGLADDIVSVEFTAPEGATLAGRRHIDLTTGESADIYYGGTNVLKVNYAAAISGESKAVWFTSWETVIAEGQTLKVLAKSATKSYTRTITARQGGIKFLEGKLNLLEIDMSSAEEETLEDYSGAYLIASIKDSKWYLMDPTNTGSIYPSLATDLSADPANDEYSLFAGVDNIEDYVFTIAAYDGAYSIKSESTGKYVAYYGSSNNAYAVDQLGDDAKIDVDFDAATKVAELASVNVAGRHLMFNSGQPRFAFYASAQAGVYLIPAVADTRTTVTLSFDEPSVEITATAAGDFSGQVVNSDPVVTGIEYSWDAVDAFGTLDEATGEVSLNGVDGFATITATFAGDNQYRPATASYTITVTDPNSLYYVKVTAAQNDWSGEYLIVYEKNSVAWDGNLENLDATPNTFEVTIVGSSIRRTDSTQSKVFFIDPMEGGYSILSSNGKYVGRNANNNGLDASTTPLLNTITWDGHPVITGAGSKTLGFNSASGQMKFRYLGNSDIALYKLIDNRPVCATPTFSVAAGEVEAGKVVTISTATDGADIYYTTDGSTPTKDSGTKGTSVTIDETTTIKAIAVKEGYKNSAVAEAKYTVPGGGNDGSLEHPYTPEEAKALAEGGDKKEYYIAGIVAKIQNQFDASYGTANFWLSVDGVAQNVFEGYKIKYLGNRSWVAGDQTIAVGDEVIIYGALTMYNSTAETNGGYLVSLNGVTKALTPPVITVTPDGEAKTIAISWAASTGSSGAVSYLVSCGDQTYTANAAGSHTFTMSDYGTYVVSVVASAEDAYSATASSTVSLTDPDAGATPVTVTFTGSNSGGMSTTAGAQTGTIDGVTVAISNGLVSSDQIRIYKNQTITITAPSGKNLTSVVFTCTASGNAQYGPGCFDSISGYTYSGSTGTWSGNASSITLTASSNQVRATEIKVTYQ